jgi:DNA-binding beta-propeller fold protein YncE
MRSLDRVSGITGIGIAALTLWGAGSSAQINEEINERPDPYAMDQTFFKLPAGRKIGSTVTLSVDPDGKSVWVFERCGDWECVGKDVDPVLKFDAQGNLVTSFGAGYFVRPHGLHVDFEGNVWVTDDQGPDGRDPRRDGMGHQVFKFSPDGELLLTLGTAGVAGDGPDQFNRPSAVFVAPNGDIFVGDGHGPGSNARVLKFAADGTLIEIWGERGTAPGQFASPHSLAMDSRGRLFVGDRENDRIQIFDQDGNFLEQWTQFGRPSGIYIDANDVLYVADSQSGDEDVGRPDWKEGIRIGSALDGTVIAFIADIDADGSQEGVTADAGGIVYGSLTAGMALRRYVKR